MRVSAPCTAAYDLTHRLPCKPDGSRKPADACHAGDRMGGGDHSGTRIFAPRQLSDNRIDFHHDRIEPCAARGDRRARDDLRAQCGSAHERWTDAAGQCLPPRPSRPLSGRDAARALRQGHQGRRRARLPGRPEQACRREPGTLQDLVLPLHPLGSAGSGALGGGRLRGRSRRLARQQCLARHARSLLAAADRGLRHADHGHRASPGAAARSACSASPTTRSTNGRSPRASPKGSRPSSRGKAPSTTIATSPITAASPARSSRRSGLPARSCSTSTATARHRMSTQSPARRPRASPCRSTCSKPTASRRPRRTAGSPSTQLSTASAPRSAPASGAPAVGRQLGRPGLHGRGNIEGYLAAGSRQKWLRIHTGDHHAPFYAPESVALQKRFFDFFLKGEKNGWDDEPPIQLAIRRPDSIAGAAKPSGRCRGTQWQRFYLNAEDTSLAPGRSARPAAERSYPAASGAQTFRTAPFSEEAEFTGP